MYKPLKIVGKTVDLEEIQPKYFADVIRWRNNKELNQFLNQPYELTMELQEKWFEQYVKDDTQGLLIMIDKKTQEPFGTIGWTDLDLIEKVCINGRLLVGNKKYNGSVQFIEGLLLSSDYLYDNVGVDKIYGYVAKENKKTIIFNKKLGFFPNKAQCRYSEELSVNGMDMIEFCRDKEQYIGAKKNIIEMIDFIS